METRIIIKGCCIFENKRPKPTCPGKIEFRLLNAMKNPLGKVSKNILERVLCNVRDRTNLNQWGSTSASISWFKKLENKENLSFFQFDIEEFYPSISKPLLIRALAWAKQFTFISDKAVEIILESRQTLLFDG